MSISFQQFVKYIPDAPLDWQPPVGMGWHGVIWDIFTDIDQIIGDTSLQNFTVVQIKEKFGGLRFQYCLDESAPDDIKRKISEVVRKHTQRADTLCELCGASGRVGGYFSGYYQTLCRPHAIVRLRTSPIKLPSYESWKVHLHKDSVAVTDQKGTLLTRLGLENAELGLIDAPNRQHELQALRDARYLAGM